LRSARQRRILVSDQIELEKEESMANVNAPLGHFDAGEDLFIVVDEEGKHRSYHRTERGAKAVREGYGVKATISKAKLHY
jgi:hypothetical protein